MKRYKIQFNNIAMKQFEKLDNSIKLKIVKLLKKLENVENPQAYGKALKNNLAGIHRYRVDNYRILVEFKDNELIILVVKIGKRAVIYK